MTEIIVTKDHLRQLLSGSGENPVLYLERDEDTGAPKDLTVWVEAYVPHHDIIGRRHELVDLVSGEPDDVDLDEVLPDYQEAVEAILGEEI